MLLQLERVAELKAVDLPSYLVGSLLASAGLAVVAAAGLVELHLHQQIL